MLRAGAGVGMFGEQGSERKQKKKRKTHTHTHRFLTTHVIFLYARVESNVNQSVTVILVSLTVPGKALPNRVSAERALFAM